MRKILPLLLLLSAGCAHSPSNTVTNREQVKMTVKSILPQVKDCYVSGLREQSNLKGRITTSFEVNDQGKVGRCSASSAEMQNQNVKSCVCQKISNATFPPAPRGKMAVVEYPFIFNKE